MHTGIPLKEQSLIDLEAAGISKYFMCLNVLTQTKAFACHVELDVKATHVI